MLPKGIFKAIVKGELLDWVARPIARRFGYLARSHRQRYYPALAVLFIVAILANSVWQAVRSDVKSQSIDLAIKARLSSPKPDPKIIILDVDERALAVLANDHGRWPWPRSVLAEAIATVSDAGARSVVFNVMMSDADKTNPQADLLFNDVAANTPNAVFPLLRLNPKNDAESQVQAKMLPSVRFKDEAAGESTIAVLFPMFAGTHDKLGINNLKIDKDGVVRRYSVWWPETGYALPSMSLRAATLANPKANGTPDEIIINWRNKRGDYQRISFADFYLGVNGKAPFAMDVFKDATVIIGASAPGIATTKGTASAPLLDDNTILATAIDDISNGTWLRLLPNWASACVSSLLIIILAFAFTRGVPDKSINRWFALAQGTLAAITIGSASYTVYLADLSECFMFALFYFSIAKLHAMIDRNASRGMPSFSNIRIEGDHLDRFVVFGYRRTGRPPAQLRQTKAALERRYGIRNVFVIDNAFSGDNLFGEACKDLEFFIVFTDAQGATGTLPSELTGQAPFHGVPEALWLRGVGLTQAIHTDLREDRSALAREVGRALLTVSDRLINLQSSANAS